MEADKKLLEDAIANSDTSDYDKGNILYLAEQYADSKAKAALRVVAEYETTH
jgi:hypothetical protein